MSGELTATALLERVEQLVERLREAGIHSETRFFREDGITVLAQVPGEYWEIDFLVDGTTDVEVFRSAGDLEDETAIERLIAENSNQSNEGEE